MLQVNFTLEKWYHGTATKNLLDWKCFDQISVFGRF